MGAGQNKGFWQLGPDGTASAAGGGFAAWTPVSGLTLANMLLVDGYITSVTENAPGTYVCATNETKTRTFPSNSDRWKLVENGTEDFWVAWDGKDHPEKWELQIRVVFDTDLPSPATFAGLWTNDTDSGFEYGYALFSPAAGQISSDSFTNTAAAVSSVPAHDVTADRVMYTMRMSKVGSGSPFTLHKQTGDASAIVFSDCVADNQPNFRLESGQLDSTLDVNLGFQRVSSGAGTGAFTFSLAYRLVQVLE